MITRRIFLKMTRDTLQAAIGSFLGAAAVNYLISPSSVDDPEPVDIAARITAGTPRVNVALLEPTPMIIEVGLGRPTLS